VIRIHFPSPEDVPMRLIVAATVSLLLGVFVSVADDKKPVDAKERADKLAALKKKYEAEFADFEKRARATTNAADRRGLVLEAREATVIAAQKALEIMGDDPKDATGLEALMFVLESTGKFGGGKEFDTAAGLVAEHHLNNPKVKGVLPMMAGGGPGAKKLVNAAAEKSADKEVKAIALLIQGLDAAAPLDDEEDEKRIDAIIKTATEYLEKAAKEAPDAKVGDTTVGKEVAAKLDEFKTIKNLGVGKPVPDVEGTELDGKGVKLSSFKGKVVLLDMWATWCGPCRAMIPHERELVKSMKDKPFVLLSVSCDDEQKTLTDFLEKEQMPWNHWFDGRGGKVAKTFRIQAFPTLYLIDHAGVIRQKWVGNPGNDKIDKAVKELVEEAIKAKG
jgi:thiol-disulfide isomerase/thioredoxin